MKFLKELISVLARLAVLNVILVRALRAINRLTRTGELGDWVNPNEDDRVQGKRLGHFMNSELQTWADNNKLLHGLVMSRAEVERIVYAVIDKFKLDRMTVIMLTDEELVEWRRMKSEWDQLKTDNN